MSFIGNLLKTALPVAGFALGGPLGSLIGGGISQALPSERRTKNSQFDISRSQGLLQNVYNSAINPDMALSRDAAQAAGVGVNRGEALRQVGMRGGGRNAGLLANAIVDRQRQRRGSFILSDRRSRVAQGQATALSAAGQMQQGRLGQMGLAQNERMAQADADDSFLDNSLGLLGSNFGQDGAGQFGGFIPGLFGGGGNKPTQMGLIGGGGMV